MSKLSNNQLLFAGRWLCVKEPKINAGRFVAGRRNFAAVVEFPRKHAARPGGEEADFIGRPFEGVADIAYSLWSSKRFEVVGIVPGLNDVLGVVYSIGISPASHIHVQFTTIITVVVVSIGKHTDDDVRIERVGVKRDVERVGAVAKRLS